MRSNRGGDWTQVCDPRAGFLPIHREWDRDLSQGTGEREEADSSEGPAHDKSL